MPLYLLTPKKIPGPTYNQLCGASAEEERAYERSDPWHNWYDKAFGFVVRAPDEATARRLANEKGGDEKRLPNSEQVRHVWLKPQYTDCKILEEDGEIGVILRHYRSA